MNNKQFQNKSEYKKITIFAYYKNIKKNTILIYFLIFAFHILFVDNINAEANSGNNNIKEVNRLLKLASISMKTDIEKSLMLADSALKISKNLNDTHSQISSLNVLVEIYIKKRDYKKGLKYGIKLLKLEKTLNISNYDTLNTLGDIYMDMSSLARSLSFYKKAIIAMGSKNRQFDKIDIFINIGVIYGLLGDYKNELSYYLKSYKILRSSENNQQLSSLLNNLGTVYASLNDIDKSLEFYKKAYSISKNIKDKAGKAAALSNIASTYLNKKNFKHALKIFLQSLEISRSIDDKTGISFSLNGLSECYTELKSFKLAEKYAIDALAVSIEAGRKMEIAENHLTVSKVLQNAGKTNESLDSIKNAEKIGDKINSLSLFMNIYDSYANYYEQEKKYETAFDYLQKYITINEKIYDKDSRNKTIEMQTMYETLQKDHQIKLLNKDKNLREIEIKRQQLISYAVISVIIIIILFFFLIYNRYRLKKKALMKLKIAHTSLEVANHIITEKNQHITDSINYAKNIQLAILPLETKISRYIKNYFIFYKPKDIVSGDFYWFNEVKGKVYVAVVDCTGHGVPGAFMSMIGHSLLNQILLEKKIYDPAGIIDALSIAVRDILKQDMDGVKTNDGMDICLCCLNNKENSITFAGARRPLLYIKKEDIDTQNSSVIEIKGTRRSVGGSRKSERRKFVNNKISVSPGDIFYLTSDGFADQSSPKGNKFSSSALRTFLTKISRYNMLEQKKRISLALNSHQKSEEQRDDITIFGFKIT